MTISTLAAKAKIYYSLESPLSAKVFGKDLADLASKVSSFWLSELPAKVYGEWLGSPIDLLAFMNIRSSGVYPNPATQAPLQKVYGNWSDEKGVPCVNIDTAENLWLVADHAVKEIGTVFVDGATYASGSIKHTSYVDSTGSTISAIELPIKATSVSVHCLGKQGQDGSLLTNPTEIIIDILVDVMGFNPAFIDYGTIGKSNTYFIGKDVSLRYVFNKENTTVKSVVEGIAKDSRSLYLSRKGKHSIKPRSVAW